MKCPFSFYGTSFNNLCDFNKKPEYYYCQEKVQNYVLNFKGGEISIGGLLSKLKSPSLDSTIAGLSSSYSIPTGLSASLIASSSAKPFSIFVESIYEGQPLGPQNGIVSFAFTPQTNDLAFSTIATLKFSRDFLLTYNTGLCFFTLEENIPPYWYSKMPYYRRNRNFSFGNQLNFTFFNFINSCFSAFCYETPFGKIEAAFRNENKIEFYNAVLTVAAFFNNSANIITADNSYLNRALQLKANFQYHNHIDLGLSAYTKIKLEESEKENDLKFSFASKVPFYICSVLFESSASYKIDKEKQNCYINYCSYKIENPWKFGILTTSIIMSSGIYFSKQSENQEKRFTPPVSSHNHSIGFSLNLPGELFSANSSYSFNCKNHIISNKKVDFGLNFYKKYKNIILMLKINGDFCI